MKLQEIEVGDIYALDQDKLADYAEEQRKNGKFFQCSGDYGATVYKLELGTLIRSFDHDPDYGDARYYYDVYFEERGVFIDSGERLVVENIGSATVTFKARHSDFTFWVGIGELSHLGFLVKVGEVD